jgi:hypothetical protein
MFGSMVDIVESFGTFLDFSCSSLRASDRVSGNRMEGGAK